jgi:hypothetical protein
LYQGRPVLETLTAQRRKNKVKDTGDKLALNLLKVYVAGKSDRPNTEDTLTSFFKNMAERVKLLATRVQPETEGRAFNTVHTAKMNFRGHTKHYVKNRATIYFVPRHQRTRT